MAAQRTARKQSRSKRDEPQDEAAQYEQELASYLQERIKPGLNKGSIPLLARSIAKELANRQRPDGASEEPGEQDEPGGEADVEPTDEAGDEPTDEAEDEPSDEDDLDEPRDEADDEPGDEADDEDDLDDEPEAEEDLEDEPGDEVEDEPDDDEEDEDVSDTETKPDFEADMRELQAELGDEWVLTFSVKGDDAWLTAEKEDGSQHVEAQTADLLLEAVELLEEGGGRSG
jgi:hypothetical protein